jgi:hypothetical protein
MTQSSWPRRAKALVKVPMTSASPPVLAKGVTSEAIMAIFISIELSNSWSSARMT